MDQLLRQALQPAGERLTANTPPRVAVPEHEVPGERAEIPPLLKAYWAVCAALLLALIEMGCDANRLAPHVSTPSAAKATQSHLLANLRQESEPSLAKPEPVFQPAESTTWIREDEPTIEVTGPVLVDPFADWAPRAVLERLPAPRAVLVHLPQ
jgi:hypothetical protein